MTSDTPRTDKHMELPDGYGCFAATIMSQDEVMALPLKQRPLNHRISSDMYHAVFEAIGEASTTWKTEMGNEVFNSSAAEKIAVDLCFKIANEAEKWRELSATEVCSGNPAIAEYVASLEREINDLSQKIDRFEDALLQINSLCVRAFPNGNGKELADLVKQGFEELYSLRWIPITERLPTIEDGNEFEDVEWSDGKDIWQGNYQCAHARSATHWRRITLP